MIIVHLKCSLRNYLILFLVEDSTDSSSHNNVKVQCIIKWFVLDYITSSYSHNDVNKQCNTK